MRWLTFLLLGTGLAHAQSGPSYYSWPSITAPNGARARLVPIRHEQCQYEFGRHCGAGAVSFG